MIYTFSDDLNYMSVIRAPRLSVKHNVVLPTCE